MTRLTQCPFCRQGLPRASLVCPACGAHLAALPAGETPLLRNGEFRLLYRLDNGGSAILYLAEATGSGERCVVKELLPPAEWKARPLFEAMFEEEARLLRRLSKAQIAVPRYYDAFMDSGMFYIVLEYVPGQNLARYMNGQPCTLPVAEVLDYAQQVVDILCVIHQMQPEPIVHGDIKPSNLIRRPDGHIMLLDFGVAQINKVQPTYVPARASAFGTPGYTPIEQWEGHPTPASDIFALGATLHQLLTGRDPSAPFAHLAQVSFADLSALTTFPLLSLLRPDAPLGLETLLTQMLHRRATQRPAAVELQARLATITALS
jgi:serine/threonine-protein kinase